MRSFYEILGIARDASLEEIIAAYRKKVLECHPDRGGNIKDFQNIQKGYEILSDATKRLLYDKWLKEKEKKEFDLSRFRNIAFQTANNIEYNRIFSSVKIFLEFHCEYDYDLAQIVILEAQNEERFYLCLNLQEKVQVLAVRVIYAITCKLLNEKSYARLNNVVLLQRKCISYFEKEKQVEKKKKQEALEDSKYVRKILLWIVVIVLLLFSFIYYVTIYNGGKSSDNINNSLEKVPEKDSVEYVDSVAYEYDDNTVGTLNDNGIESGVISDRSTYNEITFQTGDIPYKDAFGRGIYNKNSLSELELINHSLKDAVVLLCDAEDKVIRNVFISHGDTYIMKKIPKSICIVKVMQGYSWNSDKDNGENFPKGGFMQDVSYSKTDWGDAFHFVPERVKGGYSYPTYSLTLHKVENGNMNSEDISQDEFFQ